MAYYYAGLAPVEWTPLYFILIATSPYLYRLSKSHIIP